jgi:hypothetical protein
MPMASKLFISNIASVSFRNMQINTGRPRLHQRSGRRDRQIGEFFKG